MNYRLCSKSYPQHPPNSTPNIHFFASSLLTPFSCLLEFLGSCVLEFLTLSIRGFKMSILAAFSILFGAVWGPFGVILRLLGVRFYPDFYLRKGFLTSFCSRQIPQFNTIPCNIVSDPLYLNDIIRHLVAEYLSERTQFSSLRLPEGPPHFFLFPFTF